MAHWSSTRWRDASEAPRYESLQQQHPQLSALPTPQSGLKDSSSQPWYGNSQDQSQTYHYDSRRPSQIHGTHLSQYAQSAQLGKFDTRQPTQDNADYTGQGRTGSSQGTNRPDKRTIDVPLSLEIPNTTSDLPNAAHDYTTPRSGAPAFSNSANTLSRQTTSLPSFAALSEQTSRTEEPDEVEIAPMSARLSCNQCAKLGPLIREVATAVAELDGSVQSLGNSSSSRSRDIPNESAMRTVQWILERMRHTKRDMQDITRNGTAEQTPQQFAGSTRYSNPLKRSAEPWDQDDMPTLKLPRPDAFHHDAASGGRRASNDMTRDPVQRSAYSPAPSESAPGSAYPRHGSPTSGKLPRGLPSPSSLAFPPSCAASFVPANAASIGSPTTSYNPAPSIHTVSTSSATSAHLQDLQHQVSLKSLALQTLQSEYAALLQKLQRERIKSQTIEKKTSVADQEVNDLTSKNEELTEQVKGLESQLQECERKRESERVDAAKEKEQWGRMLDMSNRLQNKSATDNQRLAKDKADLLHRLTAYERSALPQSDPSDGSSSFLSPSRDSPGAANRPPASLTDSNDAAVLRRENADLLAKMTTMTSSLDELRGRYRALEETMDQLATRKDLLRKSLDRAVGSEPQAENPVQPESGTPQLVVSTAEAQQLLPALAPDPNTVSSRSPAPNPSDSTSTPRLQGQSDLFSKENLAHIARAVSPGPAELGFHVQPSTSSPEELIRALGPVPALLPPIRRSALSNMGTVSPVAGAPRHGRRESQPFVAPLPSPRDLEAGLPQMSSFRPLSHHSSPHHQQPALYTALSPHSHHSSPGPNLSNNSSPGSSSTHSPEYRVTSGREDYSFARRSSQPQLATSPSTAAMPPPPRPFA